jgi:hypothetical protein
MKAHWAGGREVNKVWQKGNKNTQNLFIEKLQDSKLQCICGACHW